VTIISIPWITSKTGTYEIKTSWAGDANILATESETKTVRVEAGPIDIIPYAITCIVALVILAVILIYFIKIRKR